MDTLSRESIEAFCEFGTDYQSTLELCYAEVARYPGDRLSKRVSAMSDGVVAASVSGVLFTGKPIQAVITKPPMKIVISLFIFLHSLFVIMHAFKLQQNGSMTGRFFKLSPVPESLNFSGAEAGLTWNGFPARVSSVYPGEKENEIIVVLSKVEVVNGMFAKLPSDSDSETFRVISISFSVDSISWTRLDIPWAHQIHSRPSAKSFSAGTLEVEIAVEDGRQHATQQKGGLLWFSDFRFTGSYLSGSYLTHFAAIVGYTACMVLSQMGMGGRGTIVLAVLLFCQSFLRLIGVFLASSADEMVCLSIEIPIDLVFAAILLFFERYFIYLLPFLGLYGLIAGFLVLHCGPATPFVGAIFVGLSVVWWAYRWNALRRTRMRNRPDFLSYQAVWAELNKTPENDKCLSASGGKRGSLS
eukprot:CAMPEP_0181317128 /NCGR_PEP_ID=MMETSP1101-20121128/16276_1 /TAXON_ID=46948 /ORGANISM="Rhodomonas abbreviata, Strain Caron Lab Isolate" /LENGTH=413 /DNA_ID=CAMNT_0023424447 /DNA_START=68 /DNA_END=1310 /DNA_ORIENTATION=-